VYAFGYQQQLLEGFPVQLLVAPNGEAIACVRRRAGHETPAEIGVYEARLDWGKPPIAGLAALLREHHLESTSSGSFEPGTPWESFDVERGDSSGTHVFRALAALPPPYLEIRAAAHQILAALAAHPLRALTVAAMKVTGSLEPGAPAEISFELRNRGKGRARVSNPRDLETGGAMALQLHMVRVTESEEGPIEVIVETIDLGTLELRTGPHSALPTDRDSLEIPAGGALACRATVPWPRMRPGVYPTRWVSISGGDPMEIEDWVSGRLEVRGPEVTVPA
jgi:hypothetical protein